MYSAKISNISDLLWHSGFFDSAYSALWPVALVGDFPSFGDVMELVKNLNLYGTSAECVEQSKVAGSTIANALAELGTIGNQPNQVWSLFHFFVHNQPNPMSAKRVAASRALAAFLSENFWCDDC